MMSLSRDPTGPSDGTSLPLSSEHRTMPKRATTDARPGPQKASRSVSGQAHEKPSEDEMGEFEDAWEDEIEDDGADAAQGGDGTRVDRRCMPHACMCSGH